MSRKPLPQHITFQALLRDLRNLHITLFHPDDEDRQAIQQQLLRIGCQTQTFWPPRPSLPATTDFLLVAVHPDIALPNWIELQQTKRPTIIAIITYESPTMLESMLELEVDALLPTPIRSFGLLSTLVHARQINLQRQRLQRQIHRLDLKLQGAKDVLKAKHLIMKSRGLNEDQAYELLREQAMQQRISIEAVSKNILTAQAVLKL